MHRHTCKQQGHQGRIVAGDSAPALSQMVAGIARRAVAKASMARLRLPGVVAAPSPTTCMCVHVCHRYAPPAHTLEATLLEPHAPCTLDASLRLAS